MNKRAIAGALLLGLSVLLLASCGSVSTLETKAVTQTTASEATAAEEQPYEQYRNATEKIKKPEEQQAEELKKVLQQLNPQYGKADELDFWWVTSPRCIENEAAGKSCIAPMLGILAPSADPVLFIAFNYIGGEYMDMDTVEIHTDEYTYTYSSGTFSMEVQKDKVTFQNSPDKMEETALRLATDDDIDMLVDILKSDEVLLRFEKFNTAKPIWEECTMPEEDKQAIADVLNAYYLYLNASEMARAKAISSIEQ